MKSRRTPPGVLPPVPYGYIVGAGAPAWDNAGAAENFICKWRRRRFCRGAEGAGD